MANFSKKIKLTNGLGVIYEKNDNADIVSLNIGVRVGSVNETADEGGICHLIEHMVFKGTTSFKAGEIATLVEAHGGELNAYTSLDQTVYYINLPARHFNLGLKILKEMAFDAIFDATELEREKEVVIEEIRRGNDSPNRVLGELLFSTTFKNHNYGKPVIGTAELVRSYSPEKIQNFYRKHYNPQNMILGICGNISEANLSEQLEELFRFQTSAPVTYEAIADESEQSEYRIATKSMDINATYFDLSFRAPHMAHDDVPGLDLLSHLLGEAETSLLEQNTREKLQLVHSIYSSCFTPKHPGLFMIGGLVDPKLINQALHSVKQQLETLKTKPIDHEKLERAKLQARSQLVYEKQTCEGTARKWISYETTVGDYLYDEKYIQNIEALTAESLMKIARKYLDISRATVVVLHPKNVKIKIDKSLFKTAKVHKTKSEFKILKSHKDTIVYRLKNGIRVIVKENHRLPLLSIKTSSIGGQRLETTTNNGINQLLAVAMTKSTKNLSQMALAEKCEWLAGGISGYTGRNTTGFSMSCLSEKLHQAVPLLADVILNPAFQSSEIDNLKKQQLEAIKNRSDNPSQTCFRMVMKKLFAGHPYEMHGLGEKVSVNRITSKMIDSYYRNIITPQNFVMGAVGDFDTHELLLMLNEYFADLPVSKFKQPKLKSPALPKKQIHLFEHQNREQAHVAIGFMGASIYDESRYALELINNILSGQGGRLFLELRDKQSMAYTVTSTMIEGVETGFFGAYIGTEPGKVNKAIEGLFEQFDLIQKTKISKTELDRAKNYIIGNHEIDHQKNSAIAMQLTLNEVYGKPLEDFYGFQKKILKITPDDIQRTAKKYITLNRCVVGVVGPKGCWNP